jgi:hypothetical protein
VYGKVFRGEKSCLMSERCIVIESTVILKVVAPSYLVLNCVVDDRYHCHRGSQTLYTTLTSRNEAEKKDDQSIAVVQQLLTHNERGTI